MEVWLQGVCFLLFSLICVHLQKAESFLVGDERGNKYIDKILQDMLEENGHEYDPYVLENSRIGFSKKVMFVNVTGEAKLHNGYITGLRTLHRSDDCIVEDQSEKLLVKANLGAGILKFHYDGTVKFMSYGPTVTVHGELAYIEVHMEFTVDSKTGLDGKLTKFIIDDMRGMKVWITGLGPLNWAVNPIIIGATKIFQRFVRNALETKVKAHLETRMPNYEFPIEIDPTLPPTTKEPEPETTESEPEPHPETDTEPQPETETEPKPEPETEPEPTPEPETDER